jgi:hypothetical protein
MQSPRERSEAVEHCGTTCDMINPYVIHLYPAHEGEPAHDTSAIHACWCEPTSHRDGKHTVWTHRRTQ